MKLDICICDMNEMYTMYVYMCFTSSMPTHRFNIFTVVLQISIYLPWYVFIFIYTHTYLRLFSSFAISKVDDNIRIIQAIHILNVPCLGVSPSRGSDQSRRWHLHREVGRSRWRPRRIWSGSQGALGNEVGHMWWVVVEMGGMQKCEDMIRYGISMDILDLPPPHPGFQWQFEGLSWDFRGSSTKNVIVLVVTVAGWGLDARDITTFVLSRVHGLWFCFLWSDWLVAAKLQEYWVSHSRWHREE